jgi:hypothetical protein
MPEEPEEVVDWKGFSNTKYKYFFNYPNEGEIWGGDNYEWSTGLETAPSIWIVLKSFPLTLFNIEAQDPTAFNIESGTLKEEVKDWAERNRQINLYSKQKFPKKEVGDLQHVVVDGQDGYKFTLTHSFDYLTGGGYILESDQVYVYMFIADSQGVKFIIWYPEANSDSQKILNSFKFLD